MPANELCLNNFRDIREGLVVQYIINILPVLTQLFCFELASMFVFVLQLLQPQFYATDTSSIKTFAQQFVSKQVPELLQLG